MSPQEHKAIATISKLPPHSIQSSIAIVSDEFEQLALPEKDPYGNTSKFTIDDMSQSSYVAVVEISQEHNSYAATTVSCQHADVVLMELTSDDEDGSLIVPGRGYDMTARKHAALNTTDEIILEISEGDYLVGIYSDTECTCPYKDLLACNGMSFTQLNTKAQLIDPEGDFILPFESVARDDGEDMWSTTATICADDQDNIHTAVAESCWT